MIAEGRRLVVLGTGTGVGKTHVACALVRAWHELSGAPVLGIKPVESGIGPEHVPDHALLRLASTFHVKHTEKRGDPPNPPGYRFAPAISPHLAAADAGVRIDLAVIRGWVVDLARNGSDLVVETAGGVFTPLAPGVTNLDLARAVGPATCIVVAPDRLGVLHDLNVLMRAIPEARATIVLSTCGSPDASTGRNAAELARLRIAFPIAVFPHAAPEDPTTLEAARRTILGLGLQPPAA